MRFPRQSRCCVTPLTWCGLALGLAVAIWGECYKVEQYPQQGHAFRVMSPAKLLSEKERPVCVRIPRIVLAFASGIRQPLLHAPAWIAFTCSPPRYARVPTVLVPAARIRKIVNAEFTYFSFRPPPTHFTS